MISERIPAPSLATARSESVSAEELEKTGVSKWLGAPQWAVTTASTA